MTISKQRTPFVSDKAYKTSEKEMKERCIGCSETKPLADFSKNKNKKSGVQDWCKKCYAEWRDLDRNTEKGYLKMKYDGIKDRGVRARKWGQKRKCDFTLQEFRTAFTKHKSTHGMKSAWGPGINNLDEHLPITMIYKGEEQLGCHKGSKRTSSNLSVDRLDPNQDYTIQNIMFIRVDENDRKRHTTYEDCKIQMRLHEERFKNEKEKKNGSKK